MNRRITSTSNGAEGHNISASTEQSCGEKLLKIIPNDWTVHFEWAQILMSDVQYNLDANRKIVEVVYNQNLSYWWPDVMKAIEQKIPELQKETAAKQSLV